MGMGAVGHEAETAAKGETLMFSELSPGGTKYELLKTSLEFAVSLRIMELQQRGGPTDTDFRRLRAIGQDIASYGDALMFRTPASKSHPGTADLFNRLAYAIAVMAHCPGGVNLLGVRWCVDPEREVELTDEQWAWVRSVTRCKLLRKAKRK
jgi:hypothetical protein